MRTNGYCYRYKIEASGIQTVRISVDKWVRDHET